MKKLKKPRNVESLLLSKDENLKIFQLLGYGCETKSTVIVQLFQTEHPYHDQWIKQHTGVLCLIKDYDLKMYFLRLYCFDTCTLLWEFKIPPGFVYVLSAKFLHTFIGEGCVYGLSFTDEIESSAFFQTLQEIVRKIKMPKRTGTLRKIKHQDTLRKSVRKNQKPVISNPVEFKHIQHFGFDDWRELSTEIGKLSGKNKNVQKSQDFQEVIPSQIETVQSSDKIEDNLEILVPKSPRQVTFEDEIEVNYESTTKPVEKSQFNFLSELNSKFDNKQMKNDEEKYLNSLTPKDKEDKEFLKEAILNRKRSHLGDDDSSETDSDDWD